MTQTKKLKPGKWMTPRQELKTIITMLDDEHARELRNQARVIFHHQIVKHGAPRFDFVKGQRVKITKHTAHET